MRADSPLPYGQLLTYAGFVRHAFHHRRPLTPGSPLRDARKAATRANPRTTMRYDRAPASLGHAIYIFAVFITAAAR